MSLAHRTRTLMLALIAALVLACQIGPQPDGPTPEATTPARTTEPVEGEASPTATTETPETPSPTPTATPLRARPPVPTPTPPLPDAGPLPATWTEIDLGTRNRVFGPRGCGRGSRRPGFLL